MEYLPQSHNSIYKTQAEVVKRKQQSRRRIRVNGHIKETKGTKDSRQGNQLDKAICLEKENEKATEDTIKRWYSINSSIPA